MKLFWYLLLVVSGMLTGVTQGQECLPSCVDGTARPNRKRSYMWSFDSESGQCTIDNGQPLLLQFTEDTRMLFVYQDGHHAGYYLDNMLCVWNIDPGDPCMIITYVHILKDLHADDPSDGTDCHCKDHLEIIHSEDQTERLCGNQDANNCPVSNCLIDDRPIVSTSPLTIKFRSDESGYAMGFFGLVALAEISGCRAERSIKKRQTVSIPDTIPYEFATVRVPTTTLCEIMDCACTGVCTVENQGDGVKIVTIQEKEAAASIVYDKGGQTAYAYANSPDIFLLRVARRAIWNLDRFNTTLPSYSAMFERQECPERF